MGNESLEKLLDWYYNYCRSLLEELKPERVKEFDLDAERLSFLSKKQDEKIEVCFLGQAAIGKSTLVNALVAGETLLLPSGGVGPLTALATSVHFSETPGFTAFYHPPQKLFNLTLSLEAEYSRNKKKPKGDKDSKKSQKLKDKAKKSNAPQSEMESDVPKKVMSALIKQAKLLVGGRQDDEMELSYLIDCLRIARGQEAKEHQPLEKHKEMITSLKKALSLSRKKKPYVVEGSFAKIHEDLLKHAAGSLSPMISELEVGWNSPLLKKGLVLVDLPGLGVSKDLYKEATNKWIRKQAKAIILVVDRAGINEASAELLYSSGFLNRLLHSLDDPKADPIRLFIAVTRVDDVADTRYREGRARGEKKKKREHFREVQEELVSSLSSQLRRTLEDLGQSSDKAVEQKQAVVIEQLIESVSICPLSAVQYTRLLENDEDEPAFIREEQESGVPQLMDGLIQLADSWRKQRYEQERKESLSLLLSLDAQLHLITAEQREVQRTLEEVRLLREELKIFLGPLDKKIRAHNAAYQEFLNNIYKVRIDALMKTAMMTAEKDILRFLKKLEGYVHWSTLRAAIRRQGAFTGITNQVDLPNSFALSCEAPIAVTWSERVLKEFTGRTRMLVKVYTDAMNCLDDWMQEGERQEFLPRMTAQIAAIQADLDNFELRGLGLVEDLRTDIRENLFSSIEEEIHKGCDEFVKQKSDVDAGVKLRMISLLEQLAKDVCLNVKGVASDFIKNRFHCVEQEVNARFKKIGDPIHDIENSLAKSEGSDENALSKEKHESILAKIKLFEKHRPFMLKEDLQAEETF